MQALILIGFVLATPFWVIGGLVFTGIAIERATGYPALSFLWLAVWIATTGWLIGVGLPRLLDLSLNAELQSRRRERLKPHDNEPLHPGESA